MAAAEDSTSWSEVCRKVGFSDNLYRDCRKNVPDYPLGGAGAPNSAFDSIPEVEDFGPDSSGFDKQLAGSALAAPPPPAADWKPEPEGFFEELNLQKVLMYGGVAALIWVLIAQARGGDAKPVKKVTSPTTA